MSTIPSQLLNDPLTRFLAGRPLPQILDYINNPATQERWGKLPKHLLLEYDPGAFMSPRLLVARLDEIGFPVAHDTLETLRSRGGGPPFVKFNKAVRYIWGDAVAWALARLSPMRTSTSTNDLTGALPPAA
jgi:hypothetical protein